MKKIIWKNRNGANIVRVFDDYIKKLSKLKYFSVAVSIRNCVSEWGSVVGSIPVEVENEMKFKGVGFNSILIELYLSHNWNNTTGIRVGRKVLKSHSIIEKQIKI